MKMHIMSVLLVSPPITIIHRLQPCIFDMLPAATCPLVTVCRVSGPTQYTHHTSFIRSIRVRNEPRLRAELNQKDR